MKSKSPFNAYKYNMTGAYANPETVIQPILGAKVAKSVIGAAEKLALTKIIAKKGEGAQISEKSFSDLAKYGQGELNKIKSSKVGGESMFGTDFSSKGMVNSGNQIGEHSLVENKENPFTAFQMKGSPANHNDQQEVSDQQKLGDIMKQPGSFAANAAKFMRSRKADRSNDLASISSGLGFENLAQTAGQAVGASPDPIMPPQNQVAESGSYAGTGDRILEMDSNPVGNQSIGRDTDIASQLFGSGQRASMLAMNGTPLHDKGHADDYEGHTHRKKGGSYKVGDYMDETDMETSYPKLYTQDVGEIKKDKKSQFMVSKNEDYNPTKIDTIRPLKGKTFKMGWGDAERNISTNPKYKQ